jgi:hypothetical protein
MPSRAGVRRIRGPCGIWAATLAPTLDMRSSDRGTIVDLLPGINLVGIVRSPGVGVILRKTLATIVVDRNCLPEGGRGRHACKQGAQYQFGLHTLHVLSKEALVRRVCCDHSPHVAACLLSLMTGRSVIRCSPCWFRKHDFSSTVRTSAWGLIASALPQTAPHFTYCHI